MIVLVEAERFLEVVGRITRGGNAGVGESFGQDPQFDVAVLGVPAEQLEGLVQGEAESLHQHALGHPDGLA